MLLVVEQMRSPTEKDKASFSGTGSLYAYPPTQKNSFTSLTSGVFQLYFDCSTCLARWLTSAPRKGGFGRKSFFYPFLFFRDTVISDIATVPENATCSNTSQNENGFFFAQTILLVSILMSIVLQNLHVHSCKLTR